MRRLDTMAAFVRVVEEKGFSAAAEALGLSKSAVSKQISGLEAHFGVRLLNRTTRRLSLTEPGQAFYEHCRRMVDEAEAAEQAVSHLTAAPRGTLRVNAPMSFGLLHLIPAIESFMADCPEIEVDMTLNDRFVDVVDEGFDLAIRIGELRDSGLATQRLAPARFAVCASQGYLDRAGWPERPEDLRNHDCLLYLNPTPVEGWSFCTPEGLRKIRVGAGRLRVNNGDALSEAARQGLGVVLLPTFIVGDDLRAGRLEILLRAFPSPEAVVHAVFPHNRFLALKVRAFVEFLTARFGDEPYWDRGLLP